MPPTWWYYVIASVAIRDCNESADPNCISFAHVVVFAPDADQARREGQTLLNFAQAPGLIRNDYVIPAKVQTWQ